MERQIRAESQAGWENARKRWSKSLPDRVLASRAIGPMRIASTEIIRNRQFIHFFPSNDDTAHFGEGDTLRLSQDAPDAPDHLSATFLGLTEKGLSVAIAREVLLPTDHGWTLDEDMLDLSDFYLRALEELSSTHHGREVVLPALLEGDGAEIDFDTHEEMLDSLNGKHLDASQADAVASCLAAERFHLIQGPPGTGKTHALAQLVQSLVGQGLRILVTSFTHRAIHHALRKIAPIVPCPIYKISDPFPQDAEGIEFRDTFADTGLLDHDGPYIIGATPYALFSQRAGEARFDVAVIDETSQLRVEAALMPMLRAQRWFFFGDPQQLPPVVQRAIADPAEDSLFSQLARTCHATLLNVSYRLNAPLALWPSENFYHGELSASAASAGRRLLLPKAVERSELLDAEPSLVRLEIDHEDNRVAAPEEVEAISALIEEMLTAGLAAADIGVVVPFRAQASRIRQALRFHRFSQWPDISRLTIDTVERFQGQEREVMIVSFAASDDAFLDRIGAFLLYPQRLNVAVTRARTKVILIHSRRFRCWLERYASCQESAALALSLLRATD